MPPSTSHLHETIMPTSSFDVISPSHCLFYELWMLNSIIQREIRPSMLVIIVMPNFQQFSLVQNAVEDCYQLDLARRIWAHITYERFGSRVSEPTWSETGKRVFALIPYSSWALAPKVTFDENELLLVRPFSRFTSLPLTLVKRIGIRYHADTALKSHHIPDRA